MPEIVLLDVGNTCMKVGVAAEDTMTCAKEVLTAATDRLTDTTEMAAWLAGCCAKFGLRPRRVEACLACSVVPELEQIINEAWRSLSGYDVLYAKTEKMPVPMINRYHDPAQLGADRLVGAYAATRLFPDESVIAVSLGTATTFDCARGNTYLGGAIAPGLAVSARALAGSASRLPLPRFGGGLPELPALSTEESLRAGFIYGFAAMTEGLVKKLEQRLSLSARVVISGGAAADILPAVEGLDYRYRPNLQLDGLAFMYAAAKPSQGEQ